MTVLQAMQLTCDECGDIVIPVAAMNGETPVVGTVTEASVRTLFGTQLDLALPLTQAQYDALVTTRPGQWEANWVWYLERSVITVQGYVPALPELVAPTDPAV